MGEMQIPFNAATISLIIVLISNLVLIIAGYTNLKRDAASNKDATIALAVTVNALSIKYDSHVGNSGIHQESMSREAIGLHFQAATAQIATLVKAFADHSKEDMDVFRGIQADLKILTERRNNPRQ